MNKNRGCIKHVCFDKKEIWIQIPPGKKLVARDALLHTRDACCTLCCGRTAKPLFHEVETVGLWVWFPSMICLGWWAGTTGPPRIPPNQGCEHPSVSYKKIDQVLHWFQTRDLFDSKFGRCYWFVENHVIFLELTNWSQQGSTCNLWVPLIPKGVFGANRPVWCQG